MRISSLEKFGTVLRFTLPVWLFLGIFFLPYAVWSFPLTAIWFSQNDLVLYRDIIYHHTPIPIFYLQGISLLFGNVPSMLRITSYLLALALGYGIYLTGKTISKSIGVFALFLFIITFFTIGSNFNIEEMSAAIFTLYASFFFLKYRIDMKPYYLVASGVFVALGIMSKQIAVGIVPAIGIIYMVDITREKKDKVKTILNNLILAVLGSAIVIVPIIVYFLTHEALDDFWYWNVTYNLFVYPQQSSAYALSEGVKLGGWLLLALIPAVVLMYNRSVTKRHKQMLTFFMLATVFLIPSLLPSFLIYKILTVYPYPLLLWAIIIIHYKQRFMKLALLIGMLLFVIPAKAFYLDFVIPNKFDTGYINEYDENAVSVVQWLQTNTEENEEIANLGLHYITTLAKRLPHNRYITPFPWLILPFEDSSAEILADPPRVVIVDSNHLESFPVLNEWPFLTYVFENYQKVETFGAYTIWIFPEKY